ncbi:MAG TPA: hypothetical protein DCZ75_17960 [Geobacter sp.]|nr:hypothetical protein [Geobacter sp.]
MSLILDALRKMEQERKSRRGAAQDLRPSVLHYRPAAQPKQSVKYPLVLMGVVLIGAGIGAGLLLKGNRGEVAPQAIQAPASGVAASVPGAPQPPAAPVAAPLSVAAPPAVVPAPAQNPAANVAGNLVEPAPVAPAAVRAAKPARIPAAAPGTAPLDIPLPQAKAQRENVEVQGTLPDVAISGIAYQDERRLRRAVLNGQLVGEGAEVAGARVVEIRENKVRMSKGGQIFEIPLSSSLTSR